ncbi:MAG TPA: hypothetical protein VH373_23080 [Jatrophihabitantaceae bacterium]
MAEHELGRRYSIRTIIAPLAENTVAIDAGAVTIGVENRIIDEAIAHDSLVAAREDDGVVRTAPVDDDGGVSLHVFDSATGDEHLRFDMFEHHPHYHYICPGEYQVNIPYDRHASGDMLDWVMAGLRHRLPDMLTYGDAPELAARIDPAAVERALPEVARTVQAAKDGAAVERTR